MTRSPIKWFEAGKAEGRLEGETIEIKKKFQLCFINPVFQFIDTKKKMSRRYIQGNCLGFEMAKSMVVS